MQQALLYVTGTPSTQVIKANQDQLRQLLNAHKIKYTEIDCAEVSNKDARSEAWAISGKRAIYPQFFTRSAQGALTFIGDWEAVQTLNECNSDLQGLDRALDGLECVDGTVFSRCASGSGGLSPSSELGKTSESAGGLAERSEGDAPEGKVPDESSENQPSQDEAAVENPGSSVEEGGEESKQGEEGLSPTVAGEEGASADEALEGKLDDEAQAPETSEVPLEPDALLLELLAHYGVEATEDITRDLMRWKLGLIEA